MYSLSYAYHIIMALSSALNLYPRTPCLTLSGARGVRNEFPRPAHNWLENHGCPTAVGEYNDFINKLG